MLEGLFPRQKERVGLVTISPSTDVEFMGKVIQRYRWLCKRAHVRNSSPEALKGFPFVPGPLPHLGVKTVAGG